MFLITSCARTHLHTHHTTMTISNLWLILHLRDTLHWEGKQICAAIYLSRLSFLLFLSFSFTRMHTTTIKMNYSWHLGSDAQQKHSVDEGRKKTCSPFIHQLVAYMSHQSLLIAGTLFYFFFCNTHTDKITQVVFFALYLLCLYLGEINSQSQFFPQTKWDS